MIEPENGLGNRVAICEKLELVWEYGQWAVYSDEMGPQWRGHGDSYQGAILSYLAERLGLREIV
jgi:hypothetical protein